MSDEHENLPPAPGRIARGKEARYTLVRKVASGGFGEVWFGIGKNVGQGNPGGRPIAMKLAHGELGARLLRVEAELAPRIAMPGIVAVVEFIEDEDPPVLVMDWGGERTFREAIEGPDRAHAARVMIEITRIVARVHEKGIAHGDLKPENVLLDREFENPKLIDFGLAHVVRTTRLDRSLSESLRTKDGLEGGTLAYLPPEAVKGAEPSLAGDVYALGVMLHEVLLGRRPDKAQEPSSLGLPEAVTDVLRQALAFDPADRYPNASILLRDLQKIEGALTASGLRRAARLLGRWTAAGLAAFFVTLRYLSVAALLFCYASIAVSAFTVHPAILALLLGPLMLHLVIRWEGPESDAEARMRRTGSVVEGPGNRRR